jgi:hypothetical protein
VPRPQNRIKLQTTIEARIISLLPPRASRRHRARSPKMSPVPSLNVVPHRRNSVVLKSPAAIRCRPSLLWLQMPQAPSVDVVPHRTGECQATPTAAERCRQTSQQPRRDPQTPTGEQTSRLEVGNPRDASRTTGMPPPAGVVAKGRLDIPTSARCLKRRRLQGGYATRRRRCHSSRNIEHSTRFTLE